MSTLHTKIQRILDKATRKTSNTDSLIAPISPIYPFSTNGVYFFVGRMGTGKTYEVWRHVLTTNELNKKYSLIIYCSTSGTMDRTFEQLSNIGTANVIPVSEADLLPFLTKHLRWKTKYYAIIKYTLSKFKIPNTRMTEIIEKHHLECREDIVEYISTKLSQYSLKYSFGDSVPYPFRTLLVLDDFAGSPLLKKMDSPLARILTKTRHYNLTCIIIAQTLKFISLNIRRLATDVIIFSEFSNEDFLKALQQFPNNLNPMDALNKYRALKKPHSKLIMNMVADKYTFDDS
jgi:Cdc6-like AAA superfamily ATPase